MSKKILKTIQFDPALLSLIEAAAEDEGRPFANMVRELCVRGLEDG